MPKQAAEWQQEEQAETGRARRWQRRWQRRARAPTAL